MNHVPAPITLFVKLVWLTLVFCSLLHCYIYSKLSWLCVIGIIYSAMLSFCIF